MKKIMISVLLLALVCSAAFAAVQFTSIEGAEFSLGAKLSFGKVKNSLGVSDIMFYQGAKYSIDENGLIATVGERVGYTYSLVDNDNTEGLLVNAFVQNHSIENCPLITDFLLSVPRVNGELKASSLSVVTGMDYHYGDDFHTDGLGQKPNQYFDIAFGMKYSDMCINSNYEIPDTKLGFIYSFDKDPSKSGLIAGVGATFNPVDGKSVGGKMEGVFHYIDGQVKVEDFVARAVFNKNTGSNGYITPWAEYRYSYNQGPEVNGLYVNIVPLTTYFDVIVGGYYSTNLIVSLHKVDGKLSFQLNEAGLTNDNFATGRSEDAGFSTNIGFLRYVYSPVNTAEENGLFMKVYANVWTKPIEQARIQFNTKAVLHANYIDDQIKVNINEFTAW